MNGEQDRDQGSDEGIAGLRGLRESAAPASLEAAVMGRVQMMPAPRAQPQSWWARLLRTVSGGRATAADDVPVAGLSGLREVTPPPSLVPAVMSRIAEPRAVSLWSWLWRPRSIQLRLSPMTAIGGVVAVAVAVASFTLARPSLPTVATAPSAGQRQPVNLAAATAAPGQEVVLVRFVLVAKGAKKVAVAGDFNGWSAEGTTLDNADGQGTFVATVPLPRGAH